LNLAAAFLGAGWPPRPADYPCCVYYGYVLYQYFNKYTYILLRECNIWDSVSLSGKEIRDANESMSGL